MNHNYDVNIATKFGTNVATFLNHMEFWTTWAVANLKNYHDGRFWIYNTIEAFQQIFPYWSTDQINRIIRKCVKNDLLVKGNYNQKGYDRTCWYSLTDKALCFFPALNTSRAQAQPHLAVSPNPFGDSANAIPNINSDIKNNTISDLEIVEAYHEELPESPKIKVIDTKLRSQLRKMVNNWKSYSNSGKSFSIENFKAFLNFIKTQQPGFLQPYLTHNGKLTRNNLRMITREIILAKLVNHEFNFK
jgi:hypothetical protein